MAEAETITLHQAADLLGVHYMTVYRYVRHGRLAASKVDGAWRVTTSELDQMRSGTAENGLADSGVGGRGRHTAPWSSRVEACLVAGDAAGAWGVVEAALGSGSEPSRVYTEVLQPALESIGERWNAGEIGIAVEHRASGIALRIVGRLGPRFVRRGRDRGLIVLGSPSGEHHSIGSAMVADLLRVEGFDVSDIGADVPAESFAQACRASDRLVAVALSITIASRLPAAQATIAALRYRPDVVSSNDRLVGVPIIVGGQAISSDAQARAIGADGYAATATDLVALVTKPSLVS
jgi:excisionase family DNA binding protein